MWVDLPGAIMQCTLNISRARPERASEKKATRSTGLPGGYDSFRTVRSVLMNIQGVERRSENSR